MRKVRESGLAELEAIGAAMDGDRFPVVWDGGLVRLGRVHQSFQRFPGQEHAGVYGTEGSAAGQGEGSTGGQGKAGGPAAEGPSGTAAPLFSEGRLSDRGRRELAGVEQCYEMVARSTPIGVRLFWHSRLVEGLPDQAWFVTDLALPDNQLRISTWAWWDFGIHIGPRHTNYDGSACVYELRDGTWTAEANLVSLFDMTTVWALRHLHLRRLGRWPGRQILHTAFERITENHLDELCGCGGLRRYRNCCAARDRRIPQLEVAKEFRRFTGGRTRRLAIPAHATHPLEPSLQE